MNRRSFRRYLSLSAAAGVLASSAFATAPGWADTQLPAGEAAGTEAARPEGTPGTASLSDASLAQAVQRDLGLTQEQFTAAGELGTRAATAAAQLRTVPGYGGIRLQDGQIVVSGAGPELRAAVAALAAGMWDLVIEAPPAQAEEPAAARPGSELALGTEQLFREYMAEVGLEGLQAVVNSGGKFVIRTRGINAPESALDMPTAGALATEADAAGAGKISPAEFVSRFTNVELDGATPLAPEADVPGGVGYIADTGWTCSTGFSVFDPAGLPAVLTAGHCASDGAARTAELEYQSYRTGPLGSFGFSQFGGPGNSPVLDPDIPTGAGDMALADPGNVGTDIAVVDSLHPGLDPLPAASTWGDVSQPEPDVKIIGTADPVAGMPVCRSGRTSGWSCGTVDAVGIFLVGGPAFRTNPQDVRAFHGFLSYGVQSSGGDSGGPYVSGNYAVGTHAAGDTPDKKGNVIQNFAVGATLKDSLAVLPGYQLELFLNKPVVSSPAPGEPYEPGAVISGKVPAAPASAVAAGSKVRITVQGQDPLELPVDAGGNWSFTAPEERGTLGFTAETFNGFSTSGAAGFEFTPAVPAGPTPPAQPAPEEPPAGQVPGPDPVPAPPATTDPSPTDPSPADPATTPSPTDPSPGDDDAVVVPASAATPPAVPANTRNPTRDHAVGGDLAYTGAAPLPFAGAAGASIVIGAVLLALARRRRRQHQPG